MPKKDKFHETVKVALKKEGWHITNDPLFVPTKGGNNFFIDINPITQTVVEWKN